MATHFWGPLHLMLERCRAMRRRGFGRIVNISSIGGRIAVPHLAPYCASKFALIGLSDAVRAELEPVRHPRHHRGARPDAHRLAGQRARSRDSTRPSTPGSRSPTRSRGCRSPPSAPRSQIVDACRYGDPELTISAAGEGRAAGRNAVAASRRPRDDARHALLPGPDRTRMAIDAQRRDARATSRWAPSSRDHADRQRRDREQRNSELRASSRP